MKKIVSKIVVKHYMKIAFVTNAIVMFIYFSNKGML